MSHVILCNYINWLRWKRIEKLIQAIQSIHWDIVRQSDADLMFTTGRREYIINKRKFMGYEFIESPTSNESSEIKIFKTCEDLISYIKENKAEWEGNVNLFN